MSDAALFVGREEGVRRGCFCNKWTRLAPTSLTAESSRCFQKGGGGGGLRCLALTRKSRRLLQRSAIGYTRRRRKCLFASLLRMSNVKIARNNMVYVGKSWIESYYKWYSVLFRKLSLPFLRHLQSFVTYFWKCFSNNNDNDSNNYNNNR